MYDIRNLNIWKKEPEKKKQDSDLLRVEVSELNLSVRSYNCLKRAGCNTIGDILAMLKEDENGLRKIRNLGIRSEKEILECVQSYKEEYEKGGGAGQQRKRNGIKPAEQWLDTEIEAFHLSDSALKRLKQNGINRIRDLYATNPWQDPGWYAVRELFEKIPGTPANA